jgi:hypothetical protein
MLAIGTHFFTKDVLLALEAGQANTSSLRDLVY